MKEVMVVVQKGDHSLGYYDMESGAEIGRTPIERFPHEFAISADARFAYSCHFGVALAEDEGPGGNVVSIVDLQTRKHVSSIDCGAWRRPHGIAFDAAQRLYILSEGTGTLLVVEDPKAARVTRALPTMGQGSHIVTVTRAGEMAFCSNMRSNTVSVVFPHEPDRPAVAIPVGARPEGSVLDEDEQRLFVVNRESAEISIIDTSSLSVVDRISTPPGPVRICCDDRGGLLVPLYHRKALARFRTDGSLLALVELSAAPVSVAFHASSRTALASTHDDDVVLIDLEAGRISSVIRTRSAPDPVAVVPLDI